MWDSFVMRDRLHAAKTWYNYWVSLTCSKQAGKL